MNYLIWLLMLKLRGSKYYMWLAGCMGGKHGSSYYTVVHLCVLTFKLEFG